MTDMLWPYDENDELDLAAALDNEEDAIYNNPPYPLEWYSGRIQLDIHNRAGWKCEHCGAQFVPGNTKHPTLRNADGNPRILTVHHIDQNPANCDWTNLVALCQACHLHVQAAWKPGDVLPAHWPQPPAWIAIRDLPYRNNGQLPLFQEDTP